MTTSAAPGRRTRPIVVIVTVVALLLRVQRLRFGIDHELDGYDGGVYLGSSLSLVDGHVPYRDFVFVQPPLITLLMAPVALLAKVVGSAAALVVATVLTGLAGAASVPLTARLVRHRGATVTVLASSLVALHGDAVASTYSLLLEPWLVLLCLLGVTAIFERDDVADGRRLVVGGVLLGLACATKIWAVVPLAVVLFVCLPAWRRAARIGLGAAVGFLVPVAAFVAAAPGRFVHDVVVVQLVRTPTERTDAVVRLLHLFGTAPPRDPVRVVLHAWPITASVAIVVLGVAVVVRTARGARPLDRFAVASAVLIVAMLFAAGTFYSHYAAFAVPFVALAFTLPLSRLGRRTARAWTSVLVLVVICLGIAIGSRVVVDHRGADNHAALDAVIPANACVVSTSPTVTIDADRYLTHHGCVQVVDPFGAALTASGGTPPNARPPTGGRLTRLWLDALRRADFVFVDHRTTRVIPVGAENYLRSRFELVGPPIPSGTLYRRRG